MVHERLGDLSGSGYRSYVCHCCDWSFANNPR